jgi:hypothetical protein
MITNYCILFFYVLTNLIDILHILSLIPKLHVFIPFLIQVLSLTTGKMAHSLAKAIERTLILSIIFSKFVEILIL